MGGVFFFDGVQYSNYRYHNQGGTGTVALSLWRCETGKSATRYAKPKVAIVPDGCWHLPRARNIRGQGLRTHMGPHIGTDLLQYIL